MAKLNRGNSHISIGQYMVQAGWPMIGRVRSVFGYDDLKPLNAKSYDFGGDLDCYDTHSPYNTEDYSSHIKYANQSRLYQLLYLLVGHKIVRLKETPNQRAGFEVLPIISTLDNPELLCSPSYDRYDATEVADGEGAKRKLTQGWQQLRGSFEPMRKSLKGLTKIFARYKSSKEVVRNDAFSFIYGIGNVIEGLAQIALVPFFLLFRLLKQVGLLVRHPFTVASYSNLVVRLARDIGYSGSWLIEGSLETVQGIVRIVMQVPKWFIQMPIRGIRTARSGYASFLENAGTQALINVANQEINASVAEVVANNSVKISMEYFKQRAADVYELSLTGRTPEQLEWAKLRDLMYKAMGESDAELIKCSWDDFCSAAGHDEIEYKDLVVDVTKKEQLITIMSDGMKQYYLNRIGRQTTLSKNVVSMFAEVRRKADLAEEKGQKIDGAKFLDCNGYPRVDDGKAIIQAYNPEAETFTLPK